MLFSTVMETDTTDPKITDLHTFLQANLSNLSWLGKHGTEITILIAILWSNFGFGMPQMEGLFSF